MSADLELHWEWPLGRVAEQTILIKVIAIEKPVAGLFGIKKSPSLALSLPEPMLLKGQIIAGETGRAKTLALTLPGIELAGLALNQYAVLALIQRKICICIRQADAKDVDLGSL